MMKKDSQWSAAGDSGGHAKIPFMRQDENVVEKMSSKKRGREEEEEGWRLHAMSSLAGSGVEDGMR